MCEATPEAAAPLRLLVLANGNGEDAIAADLIAHLPPDIKAEAYPMVGAGAFYENICPIVGPRAEVPSAGWRHTKGSVTRDIRGGMLGALPKAIAYLRSCRGRYDKVVAIGDGLPPLLSLLSGLPIDIYLDVFKTGFAHRYNLAERFVLKRACKEVFCRDDMLAAQLTRNGIEARSCGNIMLDGVPMGPFDLAARRTRPLAVALLPGSRATAPANLATQLQAITSLRDDFRPDLFVAIAPGLRPEELAKACQAELTSPTGPEAADLGMLCGPWGAAHLVDGASGQDGVLGTLLSGVDLVLSQAGTATQQALGLGKPVIAMRFATDRAKRIADEQALMGAARILVEPHHQGIAAALVPLLTDPHKRARLGEIGRQRLGGPGTRSAVIAALSDANRR